MKNINKNKAGYLFFVLGVCLYSFSDAIMKFFMPKIGVSQVIFFRTVFRFIPFIVLAFILQKNPIKTSRKKENIVRAIIASFGTYCIIAAYNYSPMTDVFVIGLTSAFFIIPLSIIILKEKFLMKNMIAIILGFLGIFLAFRPNGNIFQIGILFAVIGAILAAFNQVIIKRLSTTESELTIIFYHHIFLLLISFFLCIKYFTPISIFDLQILLFGGLIGALAQYSIIHAIKLSTSSGLASASYFMIIPNVTIDYYIYDIKPDKYILSGLALITIASIIAFSIQHKIKKRMSHEQS